ncbi:MAG TPA: 30S ribosomal protein S12 methylthiotransferase RimO [Dehalococcoidia bacterium]|nr:30S ribosomal protein S12 methylthiotransferase RimO [Dehalococcoidia bacterium]HAS28459.1 30S ribosomal protein S12 methylthiotransferase RimO [Dehalococcoidia bacterium]
MINNKNFHMVSLGCDKNAVDADSMSQLLINSGYKPVSEPKKAGIIIVNTCGFINSSKEESYAALEKLAARKKSGQILIAAGCLTQRYGTKVADRIPDIDGIIGTRRWMDIVKVIDNISNDNQVKPYCHLPLSATAVGADEGETVRVSIQGASAFLKISDGCRCSCSYCAIPKIKGTLISRPMDKILAEGRLLQDEGIREIILIAQNTTDYGYDLGMKNGLVDLLRQMSNTVPDVNWIRLLYAYPGYVSDELIELMATNSQIVPYLDLPLQHAHPSVLKSMHRPTNIEWVYRTLEKMRKAIPVLALRTTFIVGYPGETEAQFQTLLDFIDEIRFDKLGAFQYSFEEGTPAEPLGDPIPKDVKEERFNRLMEKQQQISLECNQAFIGQNLDVLIEGSGNNISIGRSYRDAPKIDGFVLVKGELASGDMVSVHIDKAMVYDLSGSVNS